jgi:hypothetical protein
MKNPTPFLPHASGWLFGRPPRSAQARLNAEAARIRQASLGKLHTLFGNYIGDPLLAPATSGAGSRERLFSRRTTFWTFMAQVLTPDGSCREALRKLQAWQAAEGLAIAGASTSAYCQARQRLELDTLRDVHHSVVEQRHRANAGAPLTFGRPVKLVDGTGVSMPDTLDNQKVWPQSRAQKPGCGFPFAKLVGLFNLDNGVLIDWAEGNKHDHESKLFRDLWGQLDEGDILLGDAGFCSFAAIASFKQRGIDTVMRKHQSRQVDFRCGRRLGPRDRLVQWRKPARRPECWSKVAMKALPETLTLRVVQIRTHVPGFRVQEYTLITTLSDPIAWPPETLGRLYLKRWAVELFFRDVKITMDMDILRGKTPEMVRREIVMHVIAYNCIRGLVQHVAARYHLPIDRLSFKGTVDAMRQWADALYIHHGKPRKQREMIQILFSIIADDLVPYRPERAEPRVKKRRPKNYLLLTKPRHEMPHPIHRNRG